MTRLSRTTVMLTPAMRKQIDIFSVNQNCCTFAEAIRILIRKALGDMASVPDSCPTKENNEDGFKSQEEKNEQES